MGLKNYSCVALQVGYKWTVTGLTGPAPKQIHTDMATATNTRYIIMNAQSIAVVSHESVYCDSSFK
jgi:hypothetical protein